MDSVIIRLAQSKDIPTINRLLYQVLGIHHEGRPDIFKSNAKKYSDEELEEILKNSQSPVFVAVDENDQVLGYAFCQFIQHIDHHILTDVKTIYIDDLCVDETMRGRHIGKILYEYVLQFAKDNGCYNVTLNVWSCNESAMRFYLACGLVPQKVYMEKILKD